MYSKVKCLPTRPRSRSMNGGSFPTLTLMVTVAGMLTLLRKSVTVTVTMQVPAGASSDAANVIPLSKLLNTTVSRH